MAVRARFTIEHRDEVPGRPVVAIVDLSNTHGSMSVTNDAEAVVSYLYEHRVIDPTTRLVYRDTTGLWDEIVHVDREFVGFNIIGAATLDEAVARLTETNGAHI